MSKLVVKKSSASNQGEIPVPKRIEKDGKVMLEPRKRVLRPRRDAFVGLQLRKGPTDDIPVAPTFTLEGDEELSVYHPDTNPRGVFELISDTPAVWVRLDPTPPPASS